jgi:dipeptidyl aminopeptidase/acylaminoacyl peptidase
MTVAFSPDGKTLASGSRDTSIRLWRFQGAGVDLLQGHTATVGQVAFSPDGRTLASASGDGTVQLWDAASKRPLRTLAGHAKDVYNVTFSPDGRLLASAGVDQTVRIWRAATGRTEKVLSHPAPVRGVAFSPGGRNVVSSDLKGTLRTWDLRSGQGRELGRQPGRTYYLDIHPTGTRVGVPHADGSARIWQLDSGSHLELRGHIAEVNTFAFSPDGELAATCSDDGTIRLWEAHTGHPRWRAPVLLTPSEPRRSPRLLTHQGWLDLVRGTRARPARPRSWQLALERRARLAAAARGDAGLCIYTHSGTLELWDRDTDKKLLVRPVDRVRRLLALGGKRCVFLGGDRVGLYERSGAYRLLRQDASAIEEDNGQILVAARGRVVVLDPSGGEIASFKSGPGVSAIARTRSWLAVGFENGNIELIPTGAGQPPGFTFEQAPSSPVVRLVPGPMKTLIAGFANGQLGIWHLRDGSQLIHERLHGRVIHLKLDRGRLIAATEIGDHVVLDLSIFREGYCPLLRSIWSKVPLVWEGGLPILRAPPGDHVCRSGGGA